jgi:hypothetical protein
MVDWIKNHKAGIIRAMFLIPILSVAVISISHVVSWYDLANPISWAIYLSVAIEIAAMSSIAAASVKVKGFSVWFVFIIVTLVQFIGNIFFCYSEIDVTSKAFKDWSELTGPLFEAMGSDLTDTIAQRRWLALLEGGLLPLISLTCLHFFIQYGEIDNTEKAKPEVISQPDVVPVQPIQEQIKEVVEPNAVEVEVSEAISSPMKTEEHTTKTIIRNSRELPNLPKK